MNIADIHRYREAIVAFCIRWKIKEFALFGSILREEDFGTDSDVDVLVTFSEESRWTLFDMVDMQEELERIFGRKVDLVSRRGIESSRNRIRRDAVLSSAKVVYAA